MSKRKSKTDDPNQLTIQRAKEEILESCDQVRVPKKIEDENEACIEIAAGIKRAIRQTDTSREQIVDAINKYFGRSKNNPKARNPLSIHMLNNYLSKPVEYPVPTYYIYAIQAVTGSLEPIKVLAEPMDARVITGVEVRQMALGKLDETISEMQRLKRELKGMKNG